MRVVRLGLLGLGQVGGGLFSILQTKKRYFTQELGVCFDIKAIAVKNKRKKRSGRAAGISSKILTTDPFKVVRDPSVDVVVELIGGTTLARKLVVLALRNGKHVVTANKALLAEHGDEIYRVANQERRWILFEASVGGGIPVIKALRESLVANKVDSIFSIINGTSNYILTRMFEEGSDFKESLAEAKKRGYAEANPRLDIEGIDAAHKLAIMVRFAFVGKVRFEDIYCEGISRIRSEDIAFAKEFGYKIKLLAIAKKTPNGIEARVQPTLLRASHILANVNGSFNAVLLHGDEVGDVLLYGRGAGAHPTASAVVSDLMDIALRENRVEHSSMQLRAVKGRLKIKSISSILSRYYLRFHIVDQPGVLSKISRVLGNHKISISDVIQKERRVGSVVPLILLTHDAHEKDVRKSMQLIDRLKMTRGQSQVIRIEGN